MAKAETKTAAEHENALAVREAKSEARGKEVAVGNRGVMLENMADLMTFARTAVRNNVAPKGMNEGQAALAIQAGLERGMGVLGGLQACVVINGVLSFRGWAAIGLIQSSGLCVPGTFRSWFEGSLEDGTAKGVCVAQRKGYKEVFVRTFTMADAKKAKLWGKSGPWTERPTNMFEWRTVGDMARFHFSEVLGGLPIAEDVQAGGVGPKVTVETPGEAPAGRDRLGPGPGLEDPLLGALDPPAPVPGEVVDAEMGTKCDGEHGGPRCGDPECWNDEPKAEKAAGATPAVTAGPEEPSGAAGVDPPKDTTEEAKVEPCPRCHEAALNLFGKCGVCNHPDPEPGSKHDEGS